MSDSNTNNKSSSELWLIWIVKLNYTEQNFRQNKIKPKNLLKNVATNFSKIPKIRAITIFKQSSE